MIDRRNIIDQRDGSSEECKLLKGHKSIGWKWYFKKSDVTKYNWNGLEEARGTRQEPRGQCQF